MTNATDMTARRRLDAVVADAWQTFSAYPFEGPLDVCGCDACVPPAVEQALLAMPIAAMTSALLQNYTESAHGSSRLADMQLRALLPRYFELCGTADWPAHSAEITFRRLAIADARRTWPDVEVAIIERFFVGLFDAWLVDEASLGRAKADAMLCLPLCAGWNTGLLLEAWGRNASVEGALKLADFVLSLDWSGRQQWFGAFWEDYPDEQTRVVSWLRRPEVFLLLDDASRATDDTREQRRLLDAALLL